MKHFISDRLFQAWKDELMTNYGTKIDLSDQLADVLGEVFKHLTAMQIWALNRKFEQGLLPKISAYEQDTGNIFMSMAGMYICLTPEGDCHS